MIVYQCLGEKPFQQAHTKQREYVVSDLGMRQGVLSLRQS